VKEDATPYLENYVESESPSLLCSLAMVQPAFRQKKPGGDGAELSLTVAGMPYGQPQETCMAFSVHRWVERAVGCKGEGKGIFILNDWRPKRALLLRVRGPLDVYHATNDDVGGWEDRQCLTSPCSYAQAPPPLTPQLTQHNGSPLLSV